MSATQDKDLLVKHWKQRTYELLRLRNNLTPEDTAYVLEKIGNMKDERLKNCIIDLVGWGDEERSEIESFIVIAISLMELTRPSVLREASRLAGIRHLQHKIAENKEQE